MHKRSKQSIVSAFEVLHLFSNISLESILFFLGIDPRKTASSKIPAIQTFI